MLCFAGACGFALFRIRFGLGPGYDEGFYLATPLRYALGDVPFRDEFFNPHRMFDLLLLPLYRALPDLTVYQLRLLWLGVSLGAMAALASLFSRFAPAALVALACAAAIWLPQMIWSPGYHVMGGTLFALAWSLWLRGCLAGRGRAALALGAASGVVLFLGAFSYLPLLSVEIVPLAVLARNRRRPRAAARGIATAAHLASLQLLAGATVAVFAVGGLLGDWWEAYRTISSLGSYQNPATHKLAVVAAQLAPYAPIAIAGAGVVPALRIGLRAIRASGVRAWLAAAGAAAALLALELALFFRLEIPAGPVLGDPITRPLRVVVWLLGLQIGMSLFGRGRREEGEAGGDWRLVFGSTLAASLLLAGLFAFLSSMAFKAMFAAPPLLVCVSAALHRWLAGPGAAAAARARAALVVGAICLGVAVVSYQTRSTHRPLAQFVPFSHPLLAGIYGLPAEVAGLEAVAGYLAARVDEGDLLLAYDDLPILYFLTRTRPAIDHAWSTPEIPEDVRRRSLRRMAERHRVPTYAVHSLAPDSAGRPNAIHDFVREHYALERRLAWFEVWHLRPGGGGVSAPGRPRADP